MASHLIGEGVVARVSTTLSTPVFERLADFPGILAGQRLVLRDESRHTEALRLIGIRMRSIGADALLTASVAQEAES